MERGEVDALLAKYDRRLREHGYSPLTLGWNKPKSRLRFHVLLEYWRKHADVPLTLLDFGCGFGDLYRFIEAEGLPMHYHGVDINPQLIEVGRSVNPGAELEAGDPLRDGLARTYDVIVASGTHNFALADNLAYITRTFDLFERHARLGFSINFLSDRVNFKRPENYYANASAILDLAQQYSSRVLLRHDYMPFEFTVIVDKDQTRSEELNVFGGFERWCGD